MAGWISSKLKVAENLLQQIDQQAAESLKQGERRSIDGLDFTTSPKSISSVSLKDQLKKKKDSPKNSENFGKLGSDSASGSRILGQGIRNVGSGVQKLGVDLKAKAISGVNDSDWTELLSGPNSPISGLSGGRGRRGVGVNVNVNGNGLGRGKKPGGGNGGKAKVSSSPRVSSVGYGKKALESVVVMDRVGSIGSGNKGHEVVGKAVGKDDSELAGSKPDGIGGISEDVTLNSGEKGVDDDEYVRRETKTMNSNNVNVSGDQKSVSRVSRGHELSSDSDSDSDSDSESSSSFNSEVEREREERIQRRRQILAAKAAAKVSETIKEQENVVARLEGEKQSLEKILEERAKLAEQEASKLQSTMIETMEAADLEKQKHNYTRMEVLSRLAKVETANADLAKSLANVQWNLDLEVNKAAELRQLVDAKELLHEELKRQLYNTHQTRTSQTSLMLYKGFELEKEMLEGEYSFITEKAEILHEKATKLEGDIDVILEETENPSEVEIELKRRLRHMTDHLIQKQAQVEALSSEKGTLLFRTEAVLSLLDENRSQANGDYPSSSSREDLEGGTFESGRPKLRMFQYKIQSGKQHLGSLVRQLDDVFYAGSLLLARNPTAKLWSLIYLVCLHLWVLYILFSRSQSTVNSVSSSVVSLENINNIGV